MLPRVTGRRAAQGAVAFVVAVIGTVVLITTGPDEADFRLASDGGSGPTGLGPSDDVGAEQVGAGRAGDAGEGPAALAIGGADGDVDGDATAVGTDPTTADGATVPTGGGAGSNDTGAPSSGDGSTDATDESGAGGTGSTPGGATPTSPGADASTGPGGGDGGSGGGSSSVTSVSSVPSSVSSSSVPSGSGGGGGNVCGEGEFLVVGVGGCVGRVTGFGHSESVLRGGVDFGRVVSAPCELGGLQAAVDEVGSSGGGVVLLPACTVVVGSGRVVLRDGVVLRGAGIGRTVLSGSGGRTNTVVFFDSVENAGVEDVSVTQNGATRFGIMVQDSRNVRVQRVEVRATGHNGIYTRYSQHVTVRYSQVHTDTVGTSVDAHGIGDKDCFPSDQGVPDATECARQAGSLRFGQLWTNSVAYYSNRVYANSGHGIDTHADRVEMAGNLIFDNQWGIKSPHSQRIIVHHNTVRDNHQWGWHTYDAPVGLDETGSSFVGQVVVWRNRFERNGLGPGPAEYGIRFNDIRGTGWVLDNTYDGNGHSNGIRVFESDVRYCPSHREGSQYRFHVDGPQPTPETSQQICDGNPTAIAQLLN